MKYWPLLPLLLLALKPGLVQGQAAGGIAEGRRGPVTRTVEAVVGPWMQEERPPGLMVVVHHDGKTQFFPFGEADVARHKPVTPDTVFELASTRTAA
jgi:CubicO group peptidase (beta-lactamase class C family)